MINGITETGRCYGMGMHVENPKVMRISREPSPIQIMMDQRHLENLKYFNYLGNMVTNDARCICEIKFRFAMIIATFNNKNTLYQQTGLQFKDEASKALHFKGSVYCTYGAENG